MCDVEKFKKLKRCGSIIYIESHNEEQKVFYGRNLSSPNLCVKIYKERMFDTEWVNKDLEEKKKDIKSGFKNLDFYNLAEDCKHHDIETTRMIYRKIDKVISPENFPPADPHGYS